MRARQADDVSNHPCSSRVVVLAGVVWSHVHGLARDSTQLRDERDRHRSASNPFLICVAHRCVGKAIAKKYQIVDTCKCLPRPPAGSRAPSVEARAFTSENTREKHRGLPLKPRQFDEARRVPREHVTAAHVDRTVPAVPMKGIMAYEAVSKRGDGDAGHLREVLRFAPSTCAHGCLLPPPRTAAVARLRSTRNAGSAYRYEDDSQQQPSCLKNLRHCCARVHS